MNEPAQSPPLPADQIECALLCAEEVVAVLRLARADNLAGNRNGAIGALLLAEQPAATANILVSALLIVHRAQACLSQKDCKPS